MLNLIFWDSVDVISWHLKGLNLQRTTLRTVDIEQVLSMYVTRWEEELVAWDTLSSCNEQLGLARCVPQPKTCSRYLCTCIRYIYNRIITWARQYYIILNLYSIMYIVVVLWTHYYFRGRAGMGAGRFQMNTPTMFSKNSLPILLYQRWKLSFIDILKLSTSNLSF